MQVGNKLPGDKSQCTPALGRPDGKSYDVGAAVAASDEVGVRVIALALSGLRDFDFALSLAPTA